jgi:hypothetical protein
VATPAGASSRLRGHARAGAKLEAAPRELGLPHCGELQPRFTCVRAERRSLPVEATVRPAAVGFDYGPASLISKLILPLAGPLLRKLRLWP